MHRSIPEITLISTQLATRINQENANNVAPLGKSSSPLGGSCRNQEQRQSLLCRLAARALSLGGFWTKTQKLRKIASKWQGSKAISFIQGTVHHINQSKQLPYLKSSLQIRIEHVSNPKNTLVLCLHSQDWFSTPIPLCSACQLPEPH